MPRSSPGGGGGGWAQLQLTDALLCNKFLREKCLTKFLLATCFAADEWKNRKNWNPQKFRATR